MVLYKNDSDFLELARSSRVISGQFKFDPNDELLMDMEFKNIRFENCVFFRGNFVSTIFHNCVFDKVMFRESVLVGLSFHECSFIECKLSNVETDFNIENCEVKGLTITRETLEVSLRPWTASGR